MTDLDYYKGLEDYDDIRDYLSTEVEEVDESQFPPFEADFSSSIIVENVPAVSKEKIPKLMAVLMKIYGQISKITEADIHMPYNDDADMTYGFCFIKFLLKEEAENAIKVTQGLAIDKKHTFKVSMYSDLDHYANVADEYTEIAPQAFNPRPDPTSWLTDPSCRDQFVIRQAHETEIYWANHTGEEPNLVYGGEREKVGGKVWCESYVCWSPQGTYLATFHAPGIKLWGSTEFQSQGKFMHQKVEDLSFSPCENYIVTYRFTFNAQLDPAQAICVWDIRTGVLLRSFELKNPLDPKFQVQATVSIEEKGKKVEKVIRGRIASYEGDSNGGYFTIEEGNTIHEKVSSDKVTPIQEPNRLKWSPDGKYLARLGADMISVYSLPSMTLLDKKSIAAKDVLDFVWSPRSNMISYWSPSVGNHPAMINIIRIPDRAEISSRKLFEVTDGRMVWQNDGEYLCVHMTKHQGKKKSYVLMFFRVKDAGVPVEQLELTEPILNTSWEPSGDRIVITYGEVRSPTIAFYSMSGNKGGAAAAVVKSATGKGASSAAPKSELTHLFTKTGVQCNDIFWSPAGGVVALAYFAPDACVFDLYDVENNVSLATRRHDRCTRLFWDPSGRFIASCTVSQIGSNARGHQDDGVNIYTFQGTLLCQMKKEKLVQFAWRPRPKDLLTPEEKKKVVKNLRKYEKSFEKEDRLRKQELHQEILAARHKQAEEFLGWMNGSRAINARLKARRVELRGGYDSDDERNYRVEVTVDEAIISSKEHPI